MIGGARLWPGRVAAEAAATGRTSAPSGPGQAGSLGSVADRLDVPASLPRAARPGRTALGTAPGALRIPGCTLMNNRAVRSVGEKLSPRERPSLIFI